MFIPIAALLLSCSLLVHAAPPPAEKVFFIQAQKTDPNTFEVKWTIQPGYFLYKDRIHLTPKTTDQFQIGHWQLPEADKKLDKLNHVQSIYRKSLSLSVPILGVQPGENVFSVHYQGCADSGYCYPPQVQTYVIQIGLDHALKSLTPILQPELASNDALKSTEADTLLDKRPLWLIMISFFGFGLLLAFTPCVLPMVPVLSGIILRNQAHLHSRRAFFLSLSYVMGLALTYAMLGAGIAYLGENLQVAFQSPWTIGGLAILFVLLALSMFDLYEVRLPAAWQQKFAKLSQRKLGTPYLSAALMGVLSTLIVSPCVTPPLVGTLAYVAQTGNVWVGTVALFFLGLGTGVPLLVLSVSASHFLPKAGHWMNSIKAFFGLLLLAMAVQMLSAVVPALVNMLLWSVLLITIGVFVGAFLPAYNSVEKGRQAMGILFFLAGVLILVGASIGNTNPLQPLANFQSTAVSTSSEVKVTSLEALHTELARYAGQPIVLDYYADWCKSCRIMEITVMQAPEVMQALKGIHLIRVDVTKNDQNSRALLQAYQVMGPPTFIFLDKQGNEVKALRAVGEVSKQGFLERMLTLS